MLDAKKEAKYHHPGLIGAQVSTGPRQKQVLYYMAELDREIQTALERISMLRDDMSMVMSGKSPFNDPKPERDPMPEPGTPLASELNILLQLVTRLNAKIVELRDRLEA